MVVRAFFVAAPRLAAQVSATREIEASEGSGEHEPNSLLRALLGSTSVRSTASRPRSGLSVPRNGRPPHEGLLLMSSFRSGRSFLSGASSRSVSGRVAVDAVSDGVIAARNNATVVAAMKAAAVAAAAAAAEAAVAPEQHGFLYVSVTDTGAGLRAEDQEQLFKKAVQFRPEVSKSALAL